MSLIRAINNIDIDSVKHLLETGADVNEIYNLCGGERITPLHACVLVSDAGNTETMLQIMQLLIEHGADIEALDSEYNITPLFMAVCVTTPHKGEHRLPVIELLLKYGANTRITHGKTNATPLHCAIISEEPKIVSILVRHGADKNACLMGMSCAQLILHLHRHTKLVDTQQRLKEMMMMIM